MTNGKIDNAPTPIRTSGIATQVMQQDKSPVKPLKFFLMKILLFGSNGLYWGGRWGTGPRLSSFPILLH